MYTRPGCHLCDDARQVVSSVCDQAGAAWREIDIEADAALTERYGDYVPVVEVDGVQQGFWRVDAVRLARRLAVPPGGKRT
ncbi:MULTISPECIES: glutaredoxin family protein [Isoptericola]|uniref:Glutaredoxin family protein n=1 Tax=Isoptericola sediminis TaxID=2733572 RepID=A0A849KD70_9MICO|nr:MULTISPECIES: glutaredoxin family protein [Isoptericola]MDO8143260.1 glutaredoxin family protein [Isoptericola sp. 178]MDO8147121.1 glutaredoxin family protein [Isoptericola sp. b515]MDO8150564.1 glutaredoxin family protein [Isoptericola sp. b408]NNU26503.1 glutaredoxin family protein [Isoptericola sediminis]